MATTVFQLSPKLTAKASEAFDAERAFNAIKNTQTVSHKLKSDWETYMKYGYFPTDLIKTESVSSTLESVYDDYAAADMAQRMGKEEDAAYFAKRADFYKNLFDTETQFMRPRNADGSWKSPFNPSQVAHMESTGGDYTKVMHGSTLGMCNMMCRGLLSYSAENKHS